MRDMQRGQAKRPDPDNSVDNALQAYVQSPTNGRYITDIETWAKQAPQFKQLLRQAQAIRGVGYDKAGGVYLLRAVFMAYVECYGNETGLAWPSVKGMADMLDTDTTTIRRCRKKLEAVGLLQQTPHKGPNGAYKYRFPAYEIAMQQGGLEGGLGDGLEGGLGDGLEGGYAHA